MNVTIHPVTPPQRRGTGRKAKLAPLQEIELWSWYLARQTLGSYKTKARELGVPESTVINVIERMKRRRSHRGTR